MISGGMLFISIYPFVAVMPKKITITNCKVMCYARVI